MAGLTGVIGLAAGTAHACALVADGTVACWGENSWGTVGDGTTSETPRTPVSVVGVTEATAVVAGEVHTCALTAGGDVWCWGGNPAGQIGDGTTENRPSPVLVPGVVGATALWAGGGGTCARLADDTVWCWGAVDCGYYSPDPLCLTFLEPTHLPELDGAVSMGLSMGRHGCVLFRSGEVRCWGRGDFGTLGIGTEAWSTTPVPVCW